MNKYQNGKIYKLVDENDLWYIGSTIQTLNNRLCKHHNRPSCMSRHLVNPTIHLIEDYPCSNKRELEMREQYYLNKYRDKCINYQNAFTSQEEKKEKQKIYKEEFKEYRLKKTKEYYIKNKKELLEHQRQKVECECGMILSRHNLPRHRKSKSHQNKIIQNNINGQNISTSPTVREC